jgi:F-type H+/Na+-transporting ATPase subunit alpha
MSEKLRETVEEMFADLAEARREFEPSLRLRETGSVTSVATGIVKVSGLPNVAFEELIRFPGDILGIAFNVDPQEIGVVLLGDYEKIQAGDEALRTGRVMDVPVGESLLGRVIDPLGRPLDGGPPPATACRLPIERPAAAIMDRAPVTEPLQTGIKVIDALIPVGRGQRELILGDRQTGKTAIALDAILNQKDDGVICIYCAIGQRASSVARTIAVLREKGAMDNTVVVVTKGNDAPGLAYIAPYAATSIAEHFMEAGRDVLIVYDDLTQHAQAYRELSLLLRRPPGREAFPGDIFYIHSRLLERATHLRAELGGGSLTALPIVETEAQNISAYIPTNLISITDGQIYLSPSLFELGVLPAVDVGKSVSRVGGKAQRAVYRAAAGDLKLAYAQFEELESFARFGARLDEASRKIIEHGQRIRATLRQSEFSPVSVPGQIAVLLALSEGLLDDVPLEKMAGAETALLDAVASAPPELASRMQTASKLGEADREAMLALARQALAPFRLTPEQPEPAAQPAEPPQPVAAPEKTEPRAVASPANKQTGKTPRGKSALALAAALILAAGGWLAFRPGEPGLAPQPPEPRAFSAAGHIAPPAWLAKIEPRASGKLESVNCEVEEPVEQGQLCARIDSTPYRTALQQREFENETAQSRLRQAEAALAKARSAFQRLETRDGRNAASSARVEAAQKALELARSRVEGAQKAQLESDAKANEARDDLEKTELVAPISGVVIARNAENGRTVEPGQSPPPFVIANLDMVRIDAVTDDKGAGAVSPGLEVSFTVKNFPGQTFKGKVMRVIGGPDARTTRIAVEAANPALVLRPGMEAEVRFSPQEKGPAK